MSGLLALLDDVAAIAKVAAASVDDVFGQAAKASAKAAGAVIDHLAHHQRVAEEQAGLPVARRFAAVEFRAMVDRALVDVGGGLSVF